MNAGVHSAAWTASPQSAGLAAMDADHIGDLISRHMDAFQSAAGWYALAVATCLWALYSRADKLQLIIELNAKNLRKISPVLLILGAMQVIIAGSKFIIIFNSVPEEKKVIVAENVARYAYPLNPFSSIDGSTFSLILSTFPLLVWSLLIIWPIFFLDWQLDEKAAEQLKLDPNWSQNPAKVDLIISRNLHETRAWRAVASVSVTGVLAIIVFIRCYIVSTLFGWAMYGICYIAAVPLMLVVSFLLFTIINALSLRIIESDVSKGE